MHGWSCTSVQLSLNLIQPVQSARYRYLSLFMTMRTHINNVLLSCYRSLKQIRTIKRSLPVHALNTLVTSLVHSRLDYCNVLFTALPACDLQHLQSLLSDAVRLVTNVSRWDRITPLLRERHWFPIKQCTVWCIAVCIDSFHRTLSNLSCHLQPRIRELDSGRRSWGLITWGSGIPRCSSPCVEQSPILTSCDRLYLLIYKNLQESWRHTVSCWVNVKLTYHMSKCNCFCHHTVSK